MISDGWLGTGNVKCLATVGNCERDHFIVCYAVANFFENVQFFYNHVGIVEDYIEYLKARERDRTRWFILASIN